MNENQFNQGTPGVNNQIPVYPQPPVQPQPMAGQPVYPQPPVQPQPMPQQPVQPQQIYQQPVQPQTIPQPVAQPQTVPQPVAPQAPVEPMNAQQVPQQPEVPTTGDEDEELLRAFVGEKYDQFVNGKFNIGGFFLASFYMFYRKMFLYAILTFILYLAISLFIKIPYITILINVAIGFLINKIYLSYAKEQVKAIKNKNTDKTLEELKEICAKKGGTSVGLALLGVLIVTLITAAAITLLTMYGISTIFSDLFKQAQPDSGTDTEEKETGEYDGMLLYDSTVVMADNFTIEVPEKFENNSEEYNYEYSYASGNGVFDECKVTLSVLENFNDSEELINQMKAYNEGNEPSEVTDETINDILWHWFSINDSFGKTYYYGMNKFDQLYLLEYNINQDAEEDCEGHLEGIINSIKNKE